MASPAPPAQQPASDPQQAESVDLNPVQKAFEIAVAALLVRWIAIKATWIFHLRKQIRVAAAAKDIRGFTALKVETESATKVIHDALIGFAKTAADHVVAEAAEQGVTTLTPAVPDPAALEDHAVVAAELLAHALEMSAGAEATRIHGPDADPAETADAVEKYLHTLSDAQMHYVLGAVLTGAQNQARIATFLEAHGAGHDVDIFASEVLDTSTCLPCQEVHGRVLARAGTGDFSLLLSLYPVRGYINCLGRDRCRGTVVGIWVKVGDE